MRCGFVILLFTLGLPLVGQAGDPYAVVLEQFFAPGREQSNSVPPSLDLTPAQAKLLDLETALKIATRQMALGPELPPLRPPPIFNRNRLLLTLAVVLGAAVVLRKLAELHNERFDPWALSATAVARSALKLRTEAEVLSEFQRSFKTASALPTGGLTNGPAGGRPAAAVGDSPTAVASAPDNEVAKTFLAVALETLGELRKQLQKISTTANPEDRRKVFSALRHELNYLKSVADLSQLLPVWQLATAMEGLLLQLSQIAGSATPSTLRTFVGGLDVIQDLWVTGARPDLFTNPPLRLLAVDDDLTCRKVVSFSLKKALSEPDLAENGEGALALAEKNAYDVVFLDVQMPGMDGYEVCTKIHQTLPNSNTPVVFVTACSDFEARAQSILSGGSDLIAKPFLTFEITVKALTFCLRGAAPTARSDRRRWPPDK